MIRDGLSVRTRVNPPHFTKFQQNCLTFVTLDRIVNPNEFLQIYSTSILTAGGNEAIMANYFPVALTDMARSWLMNLHEGTLTSWEELCSQFTANIESAYSRPSNKTDLHAVQQRPWESLRSFIQRFFQVRNIIPHISNASIVVAFRQGVRDEKMLEKQTTHDIQVVAALFSLADKCARATEGHAWHTPPTLEEGKDGKPDAGVAAQCSGNKNKNKRKKKANGHNQPLAGAPTATAPVAAVAGVGRGPRNDKRPAAMMVVHDARCTTLGATASRSVGKSRSS
jgi:hypothetical protein